MFLKVAIKKVSQIKEYSIGIGANIPSKEVN